MTNGPIGLIMMARGERNMTNFRESRAVKVMVNSGIFWPDGTPVCADFVFWARKIKLTEEGEDFYIIPLNGASLALRKNDISRVSVMDDDPLP